ncbi:glycosyl hydrolase 115 family protein [Chondrinema litorale]|uniref:glycosyl hydrolase 115 family protein n=1 Tax=Chondrinema litorale TaxID=2994555 RepID=UPI0025427A2D|nr:glycosyl hydrolase 115 family protein [Chondrinema litorale]UZR96285.1 glycosyl hydrolase 115 family protein [Chondrinema litorale]
MRKSYNDEAPALAGWAHEKFGGFNSEFYEHVFELILRLKGNYLWPVMWGRSIYEDDPKSPILANKMGVVLGTSHHEPLTRAHVDWSRHGEGPWNYSQNKEKLQEFWREGMERMGENESIVTIGMRGDGDEPMTEGTAIELLETIVKDQRNIIEEVTGKPKEKTPQMWALYKEVQEYYDRGMRVDDDITLLLCDDNLGNIRKLPAYGDSTRSGGYGIYYHFDYVGGPRNYKWINTTQISRVWEQMTTAYDYGVDQVWIVNVGDIKPMEFPISFFLDLAWNPKAITASDIPDYGEQWAEQQFGKTYAQEIATLLEKYTLFNSRKKPELLDQNTYSLNYYREFETIVTDYKQLEEKALAIKEKLNANYHNAYFQLVLHPIAASANLHEMYFEAAKNEKYTKQQRVLTSETGLNVKKLYERDSLLTIDYHQLNDGKWNHMMSQTHIGYTYWQQPEKQTMPKVIHEIKLKESAAPGLEIENSEKWWPKDQAVFKLPTFDSRNDQSYYIELFNSGKQAYNYQVLTGNHPLNVDKPKGEIKTQNRIYLTVDWNSINQQEYTDTLKILLAKDTVYLKYQIIKLPEEIDGTVVSDKIASIQATEFDAKVENDEVSWIEIPQLGKTGSSVIAQPSYAKTESINPNTPHLIYNVYLTEKTDSLKVKVYTSPTLNYHNDEGLSYAVSFDDQIPQIIQIHSEKHYLKWDKQVSDNVAFTISNHQLDSGTHQLKIWHIDSKIPFQKFDLILGDFMGF